MREPILSFRGLYSFLSNFHVASIKYDGKTYQTSEHAYQAAKTTDPMEKEWIRSSRTPGEAKRRGRSCAALREDWETVKFDIMREVLLCKFTQHQELGKLLLQTEDAELVESNFWHDNTFGNCSCPKCKVIHGENRLGKTLEEIRSLLREEGS